MNTILNINRLGLLLKRFFIENKQRELIFWGIATLVFTLMHEAEPAKIFIYISGFMFAARQFKIFSYSPTGMHYLLIPATHIEKLTVSILLSTIYFFVASMTAYCIGNVVGTNLLNYIFETAKPVNWALFQSDVVMHTSLVNLEKVNQFIAMIGAFVMFQTIFLVGSLYFKRNAVGKTCLAIAVISIVFVIIQLSFMKVLWADLHIAGKNISYYFDLNKSDLSPNQFLALDILSYLLIPFFWVVSYFRLKEKQV